MIKLKQLSPSLKEKKRYLVYEIISEDELDKNPSKEIVKKLTSLLGIFDSAKAGMQSVQYDKKTQRGVLRVAHTELEKLKTTLALVNKIKDQDVLIRTVGVSGILKKARNKYIAG